MRQRVTHARTKADQAKSTLLRHQEDVERKMEEEAVELHRSIERKIKAVQKFERAQKLLKVEKKDINMDKYNTSQEAFKKIK